MKQIGHETYSRGTRVLFMAVVSHLCKVYSQSTSLSPICRCRRACSTRLIQLLGDSNNMERAGCVVKWRSHVRD